MKSCCQYHRYNCNQGRTCPMRKVRSLTRTQIKVALWLMSIFVAYGLVGTMDYQDELAAQAYTKPTQTAQGGDTQ